MAKVVDNREEYNRQLEEAIQKALTEIGLTASGYASALAPVKTSNLKTSLTSEVRGHEVVVGTDVEYAPYVEFGTGIHAEKGSQAKKIPWSYQDEEGNWITTFGSKPQPYLRPAIENHLNEYQDILNDELGNVGK